MCVSDAEAVKRMEELRFLARADRREGVDGYVDRLVSDLHKRQLSRWAWQTVAWLVLAYAIAVLCSSMYVTYLVAPAMVRVLNDQRCDALCSIKGCAQDADGRWCLESDEFDWCGPRRFQQCKRCWSDAVACQNYAKRKSSFSAVSVGPAACCPYLLPFMGALAIVGACIPFVVAWHLSTRKRALLSCMNREGCKFHYNGSKAPAIAGCICFVCAPTL
jgi:hypothetical protein